MKHRFFFSFLVVLLLFSSLSAIDNAHFYKAPRFHGAQNFENKDWLTKIDLIILNGSTHRGRNSVGDKTHAFDIYGHHDLLHIFSGVSTTGLSTAVQAIYTALEAKKTSFDALTTAEKGVKADFGQAIFSGKFETDEIIIDINQNLKKNFFAQLNIPFRRINVSKVDYTDTSTDATSPPTADDYTKTDAAWTDFLASFTSGAILGDYDLTNYNKGYTKSKMGDMSLLVGWRKEWLDPTEFLEFAKIMIKGGVLFPTGLNKHKGHPFAMPTGYNGHWAFPIRFDGLIGLSHDIFLGGHTGVTIFSKESHKNYRVKTDALQNGFIKLALCDVKESRGTIVDAGLYLKLDHFFKGLSALSGYSFNYQADDSLRLINANGHTTTSSIINSDSTLQGWHMHALHFLIEYDLGVHRFYSKRKWQPRFSFFYNYPCDGKRIFVTPTMGGTLGLNFTWRF
jgi:hypothetical protein